MEISSYYIVQRRSRTEPVYPECPHECAVPVPQRDHNAFNVGKEGFPPTNGPSLQASSAETTAKNTGYTGHSHQASIGGKSESYAHNNIWLRIYVRLFGVGFVLTTEWNHRCTPVKD